MNTFEYEFRVRYAETDQMGVTYYANYFVWFEIGRAEYFRSYGVNYTDCEKNGIFLPVVEAHARYASPARYDELLIIQVVVSELGRGSLKFLYRILEKESRRKIVEGYTVHAFVGANLRPMRVPDEVRAKLVIQNLPE